MAETHDKDEFQEHRALASRVIVLLDPASIDPKQLAEDDYDGEDQSIEDYLRNKQPE